MKMNSFQELEKPKPKTEGNEVVMVEYLVRWQEDNEGEENASSMMVIVNRIYEGDEDDGVRVWQPNRGGQIREGRG